MSAAHVPTRGELAEQRHLVDPLDHTLELLPVRPGARPARECGSQCPRHGHTCRRSPGHQAGICRNEKQKGTESCAWDPAASKLARMVDAVDTLRAARAEGSAS